MSEHSRHSKMGGADIEISLAALLQEREQMDLLRRRRTVHPIDAVHLEIDGKRYISFCGNDYLGLSHHPEVTSAAANAITTNGLGTGAAPLISGYQQAHDSAEKAIARWKGTAAAILLPSGYQANLAAIQTLTAAGDKGGGIRFLLDKLAHASLVDAVRAAGERSWRVFPHNDLRKLRRLLSEHPPGQMQVVVTESIFSMDGDAADLLGLVALREEFKFVLLLDEAHASGVYGPGGAGYAAELGVSDKVDISVATLSKGIGGGGGAVCASTAFCSALINSARAYIYSTSIPAAMAAGAQAAIGVMSREPQRQQRVRALAARLRAALGHRVLQGGLPDSPIVPVLFDSPAAALDASRRLADEGILAPAVRPPTVPRGTSRLRITLSSEHGNEEVSRLTDAVNRLVNVTSEMKTL